MISKAWFIVAIMLGIQSDGRPIQKVMCVPEENVRKFILEAQASDNRGL